MSPKILIIGSTGKLGVKLLNYSFKNSIKVNAITCFNNFNKLNFQKKKFNISKSFVLSKENEYQKFLNFLKKPIDIIYFLDFGSSSLVYLEQFMKFNSNSTIAIANKEMIIAGGPLLMQKIKESKNKFIPLDSEHFSLQNSLINNNIEKIYITASGGPFFFSKLNSFKQVSLNQVLAHPKWKMGINNLIDSSNFINKMLEIFELSIIYNIPINKIDFLISRQAFIHSVVLYNDGIVSLNCFKNDMLLTLIKPLSDYYDIKTNIKSELSLFNIDKFNLKKNKDNRFKFFKYYKKMRELNHEKQIIFMVLNNLAQSLYLSKKLKYDDIIDFIMKNVGKYKSSNKLENIMDIVGFIDQIKKSFK